jgi:hypothetical protein
VKYAAKTNVSTTVLNPLLAQSKSAHDTSAVVEVSARRS